MRIEEKYLQDNLEFILSSHSNRQWFYDKLEKVEDKSPLKMRSEYVREFEPAIRGIFKCPGKGRFISKMAFTPYKTDENGYSDLSVYATDGNEKYFYPTGRLNIRTSTSVFGNKWQLRLKDFDSVMWHKIDYYLVFMSNLMFVVNFKELAKYRNRNKIVNETVHSSLGEYTKKYYNIDLIQLTKQGIAKVICKYSRDKFSVDIPDWSAYTLPKCSYTRPDPKSGKVWTFTNVDSHMEDELSVRKMALKLHDLDNTHTTRSYEAKIRRYIKQSQEKLNKNEKVECLNILGQRYIISDLFDEEINASYITVPTEKKPMPRVLNNYFNRRFSTFNKDGVLIDKEQRKRRMKVVSYLINAGWNGKSFLTDNLLELKNKLAEDLDIDKGYIGKDGSWL